jgi:sulfonate transport system ATP-binding protein
MNDVAMLSLAFEDTRPTVARADITHGLSLSLSGLAKNFGNNRVLTDVQLDVPAGQFLAIVGKSGCGKSTLLRLIAGLEAPSAGSVDFGRNAGANPTRMMFQEPRLLPWKRIADNVLVGLTGIAKGLGARVRALELLDEVGLRDRAEDWPAVLSGGQKQRVALARALASQPQILALDEPLGALDALTRIEMQQLIERIWLHERFTAVLVTHDVAEAVSLADRVVVIADGCVAFEESIDIPRPRRRGSPELGAIEGRILDRLLSPAAVS